MIFISNRMEGNFSDPFPNYKKKKLLGTFAAVSTSECRTEVQESSKQVCAEIFQILTNLRNLV